MDPDRTKPISAPDSLPVRAGRGARRLRELAERRGERILDASPGPVQKAFRLAERTVRETFEDRVPGLAAEAALFTLISLPALLLMVLGSLGYVAEALGAEGTAELERIVFDLPQALLADTTYAAYETLATQVLATGRADVVGVGLLLSVWTGSRAMNRYLTTLTIAYDIEAPHPGWKRRLLALGLTVGGLVGAVAVLPLLVLGPELVVLLAPDTLADATLTVAGWLYWPALGLLVLAGLTTVFHLGVPWHTPWLRDLPGAVLAMLLWMASAAGLRAYLAFGGASGSDAAYQQLGVPIAIVLWLYVSAIAVLLGAELNAEIEKMWPTIEPAVRATSAGPEDGPGEQRRPRLDR